MIEGLRPLYGNIIRPVGSALARLGVHPNVVTFAGIGLFGGAGWYAYAGCWGASIAFAVVGAIMDGLDGLIAREHGKKSLFGAVLDSTADRITEILWTGGLLAYYASAGGRQGLLGALAAFSAASAGGLVSYVKARAEGAGISVSRGLMQRPERIILLCILLLAGKGVMVWGLTAFALLSLFTALHRLCQVAHAEKKMQ
jgi:CDP-diacylglycerol---glycerol-3-phosphate 3-phosphatidyltransferase